MSASGLLLGIDGGGSKTRALVTDRAGVVLGEAVATSSNYHAVGFDKATLAIRTAIDGALAQAGGATTDVVAACFGLAGVGRHPAEREMFQKWVQAEGLAPRSVIVNDAELVLAAIPDGDCGVAVICGTGSVCIGRGPDGEIARAGGWGYLVGDEGSGFNIAVRAIRLATQTVDGRADADGLFRAALDYWKIDSADGMVAKVYSHDTTVGDIADFSRHVLALAERGDPHAHRLLTDAARALGHMIEAVIDKLGLVRPAVAFGGGLLCSSRLLRTAVVERVGRDLGEARLADKPAIGAITLALRLLERGP
jgi:N-acetylglucosamine kinase-like BadF-type ATPase